MLNVLGAIYCDTNKESNLISVKNGYHLLVLHINIKALR
jgi:hypothetical protein